MKIIDKFERWTRRVYKPVVAEWKRPVLFTLSLTIELVCMITAYTQHKYEWAPLEVWFVIGLFFVIAAVGILVAIFCKDYWVALVLGKAGTKV